MGFMTSYKHLEKLCGDVMGDQRRLSAYIEEMERKPMGPRYVAGWNEDLRRLKHYRWVRNQIVHDPDCEEEDLCAPADADWLEDFYDRIMEQTDPLALYRKATQPKPVPRKPASEPSAVYRVPVKQQPAAPMRSGSARLPHRRRPAGCAMFLLGAAVIFALLLI